MPAPDAPDDSDWTIDDLASVTRVPSRTIRFYQSKGALMPPDIRGRVAHYGKRHQTRLELIAQLQDRGLRIDAIRDLLASIDRGELDLAEWLGVEQELQASWADDQPRTVSEPELYELAGSRRPGLLADLVRVGLVERLGDVYLLKSPALLAIASRLEAAGLDLATSAEGAALLRKHVARAASELIDFFFARAAAGAIEADDLAKPLQALRSNGVDAMRVLFAREVDRAMRDKRAKGELSSLPARAKKAKKKQREK